MNRDLTENIPVGTYVNRVEPDGRVFFSFVSTRWLQMCGFTREQFMADQMLAFQVVHPDDRASLIETDRRAVAEFASFRWEGRLRVRGETVWVAIESNPRIAEDGGAVWEGVMIDITARKMLEARLRSAEHRQRKLLEHLPIAMLVTSRAPAGEVLFTNRQFQRTFGYPPSELTTVADWAKLAHPDPVHRTGILAWWGAAVAGAADGDGLIEPRAFRIVRRDGKERQVLVSASIVDDMLITAFEDVTDRLLSQQALVIAKDEAEKVSRALEVANRELDRLAGTDPLTGAQNRRAFERAVDAEVARKRRQGRPLSLLLLDVDRFKVINDTYGHQAGDDTLIEVCERLRDALRETDSLARWGGEEFAVLLPDCELEGARQIAEKLRASISIRPFPVVGRVTCSVGVVEFLPEDTLDTVLWRADDGLYAAKSSGRDSVRVGRVGAAQPVGDR